MRRRQKAAWYVLITAVMLLSPGQLWATGSGGQESITYVGSDTCLACHDEMEEQYGRSLHFHAWQTSDAERGCESCHGPGAEHADDPEPDNIVSYGVTAAAGGKAQDSLCLQCHSTNEEIELWEMGRHAKNDISCTNCHTMHAGYSPTTRTPETCYTCHLRVKIDGSMQARHPIRENKVGCSDCHNPHGSANKAEIRAESTNELCYSCHGDKRGPHLWEHPPAEENCLVCHEAHGSRHKGMLVQKVPTLCYRCHQNRHSPPYGAESGFTGSTPKSQFYARACLNCHQTVHGSNGADRRGKRFIK